MPQKLKDYDETRLSDDDILAGVRDLINGTHWVQESLATHCWVPLKKGENPDDYDEVQRLALSFGSKEKLHYRKAQYCVMGMVLRVADVEVKAEFSKAKRIKQIGRIVDRLYAALPKKFVDEYVQEEGDSTSQSHKITAIEVFNDHEKTTKAKIRKLVEKALEG